MFLPPCFLHYLSFYLNSDLYNFSCWQRSVCGELHAQSNYPSLFCFTVLDLSLFNFFTLPMVSLKTISILMCLTSFPNICISSFSYLFIYLCIYLLFALFLILKIFGLQITFLTPKKNDLICAICLYLNPSIENY